MDDLRAAEDGGERRFRAEVGQDRLSPNLERIGRRADRGHNRDEDECRTNHVDAVVQERRQIDTQQTADRSDDIVADIARLKSKGYRFLSDQPTAGAHESLVAFIHPDTCDGVLVELSQPREDKSL